MGLTYLLDFLGAEIARLHQVERENVRLRKMLGIPDGMPLEMFEAAAPRTGMPDGAGVLAGMDRGGQ